MFNLENKVALVTGAASKMGMGRAIALRLAKDGADVAVNDIANFGIRGCTEDDRIEDWHGLKDVAAEIEALGRRALVVEADISSHKQVERMVKKCLDTFGKIDILVNNAAIIGTYPLESMLEASAEDWHQMLAVNLLGAFWCCKAVASQMIERGQGGKIINTASEGVVGAMSPGCGLYMAAKFGVLGFTQALALELAQHKINVNAVCPGVTATEMVHSPYRGYIKEGMSREEAAKKAFAGMASRNPFGRVAMPEDIANVVAFLASSDSDYLSAQAVAVTGGHDISM